MPTGEKERFMVGRCRKFFQSFVVNESSLPEWLTVFLLSVSFFTGESDSVSFAGMLSCG